MRDARVRRKALALLLAAESAICKAPSIFSLETDRSRLIWDSFLGHLGLIRDTDLKLRIPESARSLLQVLNEKALLLRLHASSRSHLDAPPVIGSPLRGSLTAPKPQDRS
jgi:hypothetical protein